MQPTARRRHFQQTTGAQRRREGLSVRDWPRGAYVNTFQSILGSDGDLTLRFATLEDAEALLRQAGKLTHD